MFNSVADYVKGAALKYGDKLAFIDKENSLSFRNVEELSSRIATRIVQMGLYKEPILVLTERNVFTPIAYLGIAKSGNFYIPIDSTINTNRINQIISISEARLLLTNITLNRIVSELDFHGETVILEELMESKIDEDLLLKTYGKIDCLMPLYVIFTSGSTGIPKGVITSHLSLINYIEAVNDVLKLTIDDILGNQSPLDYIAAIRDIYLPLLTGATTVIIPKNEFAMAEDLARTLDLYKISILCWSAAGLEMGYKSGLLEELKSKSIRKVLFSGSVLPGKVLKMWQNCFPEAVFINQYGPTEATASCTYYVVKEKAENSTVLPIGVPYKNYNIILLSDDGTAVENGEIGEICVSGVGVSLGYFKNKELTDKSFVQNPLNEKYREIIYKTGDLGRYDGNNLLFCGRKDRQIKHLGHRIELEEIELCAKKLDGINECVAIYDNEKSILSLIYSGCAEKKSIVLHYREELPSFMVPRKVIHVEEIPHLPNGKIDVNAVKDHVMKEEK